MVIKAEQIKESKAHRKVYTKEAQRVFKDGEAFRLLGQLGVGFSIIYNDSQEWHDQHIAKLAFKAKRQLGRLLEAMLIDTY